MQAIWRTTQAIYAHLAFGTTTAGFLLVRMLAHYHVRWALIRISFLSVVLIEEGI